MGIHRQKYRQEDEMRIQTRLQFYFLIILLIVMQIGLSSCFKITPEFTEFSKLKNGEIVLVGRIEVDPPKAKPDEDIEEYPEYYNLFFSSLNDKYIETETRGDRANNRNDLNKLEWFNRYFGKTFTAVTKFRPVYINPLGLTLELGGEDKHYEHIYLPPLKVEYKKGDRAVYMGTVRFHRNKFWDVEKVEIIDDYKREKREFEKKFGKKFRLVKRLASTVKK